MSTQENPLTWGRVIQFPRTEAARRRYLVAGLRKERRSLIREEIERFERAVRLGLIPPAARAAYFNNDVA